MKYNSIGFLPISSILLLASCATRPNVVDNCPEEIHPAGTWLMYVTPDDYIAQIKELDGNLLVTSPGAGTFTLLPLSQK
jgi:hypothetical protein